MSDNTNYTSADKVEAILTAQPRSAAEFAEVLGLSESTVRKALKSLAEADKVTVVEVEGQPTTFRKPKADRAHYGYKRNTSQGAEADARTRSLRTVLAAAEGSMTKQEITDAISELEGAEVTKRAVDHVIWRHRVERHEGGQPVPRPFVRQVERGKYELDAEYEASNTEPEDSEQSEAA